MSHDVLHLCRLQQREENAHLSGYNSVGLEKKPLRLKLAKFVDGPDSELPVVLPGPLECHGCARTLRLTLGAFPLTPALAGLSFQCSVYHLPVPLQCTRAVFVNVLYFSS